MLEQMLVEEIVSSGWKARLAEHWSMHELKARRQAAISILKTFAGSSGLSRHPSGKHGDANAIESSGWDCKELTIKVGAPMSVVLNWSRNLN